MNISKTFGNERDESWVLLEHRHKARGEYGDEVLFDSGGIHRNRYAAGCTHDPVHDLMQEG